MLFVFRGFQTNEVDIVKWLLAGRGPISLVIFVMCDLGIHYPLAKEQPGSGDEGLAQRPPGLWQLVCVESENVKLVLENGFSILYRKKKSRVNLLMIYLGKKLFISRFAWWNELLFLNENYCQGLKAAVVASGLGESACTLPQVQGPGPVAAKTCSSVVSETVNVSWALHVGCWGHAFTTSLVKESHRVYILLILNFGLRMVNSLRPGSTPCPSCP